MTQELIDLRLSILEGRYQEALAIVDELESMSKQAILRNIRAFVIRLLIHLIKNQVEQRLTNSWATSIRGSIREIQKLNLKDNKSSYYVSSQDWIMILEDELEEAIASASDEVNNGQSTPFQLAERVNREQIFNISQQLLELTYIHSAKTLTGVLNDYLTQRPGGEDWREGKSNLTMPNLDS